MVVCFFQSVLAKTCVKLLCEDPAFSEYIKCILMDERTFLNNNVAYSFLTCFLHKVHRTHLYRSSRLRWSSSYSPETESVCSLLFPSWDLICFELF